MGSAEHRVPAPITLLLVDDEQVNLLLLQALVRSVMQRRHPGRELRIDLARHGGEALQLLADQRYTGVFLDLMMPEIDGFQVLDQMKQRGDRTPVVVVTAVDRSLRSRVPLGQVLSILPKPVDPQRLADAVSAVVEQAGVRPG
jgi:CheY-like chemotaxis protein